MVLHLGEHDPVPRPGDAAGDEVQGLGRVAGEHGVPSLRADEAGDPVAGALEEIGRLGGDGVDAAVDRRTVVRVVVLHRREDRARGLRGRTGVEVDDPLALERRELRAQVGGDGDRHRYAAASSSRIQP